MPPPTCKFKVKIIIIFIDCQKPFSNLHGSNDSNGSKDSNGSNSSNASNGSNDSNSSNDSNDFNPQKVIGIKEHIDFYYVNMYN